MQIYKKLRKKNYANQKITRKKIMQIITKNKYEIYTKLKKIMQI